MTLALPDTDKRPTTDGRARSLENLAAPIEAGTARATSFSAAGVEARKRKAERTTEQIAADALRKLLVRVDAYVGEREVSPRDAATLIRALREVAAGPRMEGSAAEVAARVVESLRAMAAQGKQASKGRSTPTVET